MNVMRLTTSHRQTGSGALSGRRISRRMAIAVVAVGLLLTFVLDRGTGSAPFQHAHLPIIFAAFTLNWGGGLGIAGAIVPSCSPSSRSHSAITSRTSCK
jgi:hypothetical protein